MTESPQTFSDLCEDCKHPEKLEDNASSCAGAARLFPVHSFSVRFGEGKVHKHAFEFQNVYAATKREAVRGVRATLLQVANELLQTQECLTTSHRLQRQLSKVLIQDLGYYQLNINNVRETVRGDQRKLYAEKECAVPTSVLVTRGDDASVYCYSLTDLILSLMRTSR